LVHFARDTKDMKYLRCFLAMLALMCIASLHARRSLAGDNSTPPPLADIHDLVDQVQKSVVVITFTDRDGQTQGLGSGFIVGADGLVATNLHVIGEARPITVRTLDGHEYPVQSIHAHERSVDLAILKIDAADLPALELGDSDSLVQGQPLVAFGNPQGLEHSVVTGIVSAIREEVDGVPMIQLAIPIERGNSGGPVVDLEGRVHGLLTLKSLVTENLGYAVTINALKPLLEEPNPIPMSKWLTIGILNPRYWTAPDDGARWTQRAGHILVNGVADGFGGRSLCLSTTAEPALPFEVAVSVKMNEEDGAAGLAIHCDGDTHYGFYPSSGSLRFSRFDGPVVYDWHVLREEQSPTYRPGEWNRIKVRVEPGRFLCYCNDELVFEVADAQYESGQVGLVKFRHTTAEFKGFAVGDELPSLRASPELLQRITDLVADIPTRRPPNEELIAEVATAGVGSRLVLEERARTLELQAQRLRELSRSAHARQVREQLLAALSPADGEPDLLHAALLIAALDNDELDVDFYRRTVDDLAAEFLASLPADVTPTDRLAAFDRFFFEEQGFHGSRTSYYTASNSYLNEVIDDREGLPITLSLLYVELARRAGFEADGIGLPGHFIAQVQLPEAEPQLIDVFDRGRSMTRDEAVAHVVGRGLAWDDEYLRPQTPREIVTRIVRNLINLANDATDAEAALRYTETVLALNPDSAEDRLFKAVLCYNTGRAAEGLAEVDWILEREPEGILLDRVRELRAALEELPQE
jgi:S1-C subfamily serine protease/regulator of sirC expression with transglutaminase-like and TPR domain